jgi:hypothetical protein
MRFSLILGLLMSIAWGGHNTLRAADKNNLSFSLCLQINGEFEHSKDYPTLERVLNVQDLHPEYTLKDVLLHYLTQQLNIQNIENLNAYCVSVLSCGAMITQIESIPCSAAVSPALAHSESAIPLKSISPIPFGYCSKSPPPELLETPSLSKVKEEFTSWNSLLTLKGEELIQVINGKLLKVSFKSITDSVRTLPDLPK